MNRGDGCATTDDPWSVIESASANSTLAGVLAGFLVAAIAVLYQQSRSSHGHTLALFFSGVVTLGLASHLFSSVSGLVAMSNEACARAWSQGIVASGMLATGSIALVAGLAWMLTRVADGHTSRALGVLGGALTACLVFIVTLRLVGTAVQYLGYIYGGAIPTGYVYMMGIVGAVSVVWGATVSTVRTLTFLRKSLTEHAVLAPPKALPWATAITAVLAVLASAWTGAMPFVPLGELTGGKLHYVAIPTLVVGLVLPGVFAVLISHSVPKLESATPSPLDKSLMDRASSRCSEYPATGGIGKSWEKTTLVGADGPDVTTGTSPRALKPHGTFWAGLILGASAFAFIETLLSRTRYR